MSDSESRTFSKDYLASLVEPSTRTILNNPNNELGPALIASIETLPELKEIHDIPPDVLKQISEVTANGGVEVDSGWQNAEEVPLAARGQVTKEMEQKVETILNNLTPPDKARYRGVEVMKGGIGQVYIAWDTKMERVVAIKVTDISIKTLREAQGIASLNHPNILKIYGLADMNGKLAIVSEWVGQGKGMSVADLIYKRDHLAYLQNPPTDLLQRRRIIADSFRAIGSAIAYSHEKQQANLDIKPGNLMFTETGPVIIDYGLSTSMQQSFPISSDKVIGTVGYRSAAQTLENKYYENPQALVAVELFSTAVTFWKYLTFTELFDNSLEFRDRLFSLSPQAQQDLLREYPQLEDTLRKLGVPRESWARVAKAFSRALFLDAEPKYLSVEEFTTDLAEALESVGFNDDTQPIPKVTEEITQESERPVEFSTPQPPQSKSFVRQVLARLFSAQ